MDDKIISLLNQLLEGQKRIENKLNSVVEQTADLTEFKTESLSKLTNISLNIENIKDDLSNVEVITASNWKYIAKLKAVK